MPGKLTGMKIAFLATDGVEQIELTEPWEALKKEDATVELVSPKPDEIQGVDHMDKGTTFPVDHELSEVGSSDYDALVLPGGVANPDFLRLEDDAVKFVHGFFEEGKPVAAICHGPWMLVEADVVRGRTLTSWPSLKTDIGNAGGTWVDEKVHEDSGLITSRKPDDLLAFCSKIVQEFAKYKTAERRAAS
ncbi:MAG TPA: type 1 glutamine amidotransferase domain-containing protein [Acidimicrobiales bacterium]|nr:type 1 glutamine amidotransferase domain-containing protein [Acidimicrobiales bacterium]